MQITTKIREQLIKDCQELFPWEGKGSSVEKAAEGYLELRKVLLPTLQGVFNRAELTALVDRQNGLLLTRQYQSSKEIYIYGLEDAQKYEGTFTRHGASLEKVKEKISYLDSAQVFFLQEAIDFFWQNGGGDLNAFLDTFAEKEKP